MEQEREFLDSKAAADYLGISVVTLGLWRTSGAFKEELPHFKMGRRLRYRKEDLRAFLEACRAGTVDFNKKRSVDLCVDQ